MPKLYVLPSGRPMPPQIAKGVLFFVGYLPERLVFKGYGEIFVRK